MRIGPRDKFWMVIDPTADSVMADICFETTLEGFVLQLKGGLTMDRHPTIFTNETEADVNAFGRLVAMLAYEAIARQENAGVFLGADRILVLDEDGEVLFESKIK